MDHNLAMPSYLDESLVNNIDFLRGENDNIDSLNKGLEVSVLNINCGEVGKLNNVAESTLSLPLSSVDLERDTADDTYIEVKIERTDEAESLIIIKDVPDVAEVSEEASKLKQENAVQYDVWSKRKAGGSAPEIVHDNVSTEITVKSGAEISQDLYCSSCKKTFSSSADFHRHMKIHRKERLQCTYCNKTFKQLNHLNMHIQIHLGKRLFQCEKCLESFKCKSSLNSHMKKHLGVKDFSCDMCSASFHSKYELKIHITKHTGELPYKCKECGDEFPIASRLRRHMMIHTGERPFQCEVCGVVFREQFTLNNHMGVHLPRGPYPCDICGEEFSRLNFLTLHRRVHNTDSTYSYIPQKHHDLEKNATVSVELKSPAHSSLSDASVHDEPELKVNFLTSVNTCSENKIADCTNIEINSNVDQELPADISDAVTEAKASLDKGLSEGDGTSVPHPSVVQHALSTGTLLESQADDGKGYLIVLPKSLVERNYTLYTVCSPSATSKTQDSEDQDVVKDSNDGIGNSCNLFVYDNSLESIAEVPFQSDQEAVSEAMNKPKRSKKQKEALSDDMNTAVGSELLPKRIEKSPTRKKLKKKKKPLISKLYHCQQCGKDYKTSSNLNIHMRTHTGERPYYCDFCGLGFKQLAHLKSHVRIHTGENPYQCHLCDRAFNQSSRLKYHIQNVHIKGRKKRTKIVKQCSVRNFYCKICDYTFLDSCFKTEHMKTHLDGIRYKYEKYDASAGRKLNGRKQDCLASDEWGICELCGFQYKDVAALNSHKKELHGVTEDSLEMASEQSESSIHKGEDNQMNFEIAPSNDGRVYSRPEIDVETSPGRNSPTESTVALPSESASNIRVLEDGRYQCGVCDKLFNSRSNVRVHLRLHADVRPYKCNDCGRAFRQISHLKDHVKMHTGKKPFRCSVCPAAFTQSSGVKVHIKNYHNGKAFAINDKKEKDMRQDSIDGTVIINIESGRSASIERLRLPDEENYSADVLEQCDICGKGFLARYMKYHMRTHKKLSYKCIVCRKLHKKYELLSCNRNQEGKPYVCNKCEYDEEKFNFNSLSHNSGTDIIEAQQKGERKDDQIMENMNGVPLECADNLGTPGNFEKNELHVGMLKEAKNICNICNKHFRRKSSLQFHKQFSHRDGRSIDDKNSDVRKIDNSIKFGKVETISKRIDNSIELREVETMSKRICNNSYVNSD